MDDFLIGPQSDEKEYTWWDYEMEYNYDEEIWEDYLEQLSYAND